MTAILGLSAYYHDSAAALLQDGRVVAAAQEERFTRKKHDAGFPHHAIQYCLSAAGLNPEQLDYVAFYDKPLLKFDRLLETYLAFAPRGLRSFAQAVPLWLNQKLHLTRELRAGLKNAYRRRFIFAEHHESHAASAFFPSPFEEAAILTFDGVGEWATASFGVGRGNRIALSHEMRFPHSLGLLYSAFTYYCGFTVNSGEYKLMGLAPYGTPRYAALILEKLVELKDDGSFRLDMRYFNYGHGLTMTSVRFERLFGGPPRRPDAEVSEREKDLAASIQAVTETILLRAARHVHARTGLKNLCMAGGVALNAVANGRIVREGPFERLWVQPAAGDAGGALGVAQLVWHQLLDRPREAPRPDGQGGSLWGPSFGPADIETALKARGARYRRIEDEAELMELVAEHLAAGRVVGWMQGRMEFGPRALGARSILADARSATIQARLNQVIKFRESFRPFAPAVLKERAEEYFALRPMEECPYMTIVAPLAASKRLPAGATHGPRSDLPAVTHVDYSARVQTVDAPRHGRFHALLRAFEAKTGCPVLVNTSFNVRDEPIVCTPDDAYRCFMATEMEVLVIENFVLSKSDQMQVKSD